MLTREINKQYLTHLSVAASLFLMDRYAKQFAASTRGFFILPRIFGFSFSSNDGIAVSLPVPAIISVPLSVALIGYLVWIYCSRASSKIGVCGFGLLLGGALSNLYDRLAHGFVIDYLFLKLPFFHFAFNLADCAIVAGVLMLTAESMARRKKGENEFSLRVMDDNQKTYNLIADEFAETRKKPLWEEVYSFKPYIHNGSRLIDIGCGSGRLLSLFNGMNIDYTGVDNSPALLNYARKQAKKSTFKGRREFTNASICALPFPDNFYDCAFMIACLNHIPPLYQLKTLQEAHRALAPGGILCMTNFNLLRFSLKGKTVWRYRSFPNVITCWQGHPLYYYAFTLSKLKRLCRVAGFIVLEAYYARRGARARWWNGNNLVVIAKK